MPISAFGYFAFVIVPVNYVLIVFYFPCYIVIYENYVKEYEQYYFGKLMCFANKNSKLEDKKSGKNENKDITKAEDIEMAEVFDKPLRKKHPKDRSESKKKKAQNQYTTRGRRQKSTKIIVRKNYVEDDGYYEGGSKNEGKDLATVQ